KAKHKIKNAFNENLKTELLNHLYTIFM
ncbi:MAG: hypothetical protein ACI8WT_003923, partial [Clostridium sp.]